MTIRVYVTEYQRTRQTGDSTAAAHHLEIGPVVAALGGPRVPDLCDAEYATLFVLALPGNQALPRLVRASYGAPDSPEGVACAHKMRMEP